MKSKPKHALDSADCRAGVVRTPSTERRDGAERARPRVQTEAQSEGLRAQQPGTRTACALALLHFRVLITSGLRVMFRL